MKAKTTFSRILVPIIAIFMVLCLAFQLAACNSGQVDALEYIVLNTDSVQKTFEVDDEFTYDGLVVTAHYSDGATEEVTDFTVKPPKMSTVGVKEVVVKYGGVKSQYIVTVNGADATGETCEIGAPVVKYVYDKAAVEVNGATQVDGNDLTFYAKAQEGYSLAKITAKVDGVEVAVESDNGKYTVPASALTGNAVVTIAAATADVENAEYIVNYYNESNDLLAVYGYESKDEALYKPESKYYTKSWVDTNGRNVASLSDVSVGNVALIQSSAPNETAQSAITAAEPVLNESTSCYEVKISIPQDLIGEYAENGDLLCSIGVVLTNEENVRYTVPKDAITELKAPTGNYDYYDGQKSVQPIKLNENAYLYPYGWANYSGSLTLQFNISSEKISGYHFYAWSLVNKGEQASAKFDFSLNTENSGTLLTYELLQEIGGTQTGLSAADSLHVVFGNSNGGPVQSTKLLKFGTSNDPGKLTLTFEKEVIKVAITWQSWSNKEGKLTVNDKGSGDYQEDKAEETFVLDEPTKSITIETLSDSHRALIFEIVVYFNETATVKPAEKITEALAAVEETLTVYSAGVTDLPKSSVDGVEFEWTVTDGYSSNYSINSDGNLEVKDLPEQGETIQLTVTATHKASSLSATKIVTVTIPAKSAQGAWKLVEKADDLKVGNLIIIVNKDGDHALSTTQDKNNRKAAEIEKNSDGTPNFDAAENVQEIILEQGTSDGTFAFFVTGSVDGYLYAASSDNNYLRTENSIDGNASWKIEIGSDNVATVTAQGNNSHNQLKYNNSSTLFSCYESGQQAVKLYTKARTPKDIVASALKKVEDTLTVRKEGDTILPSSTVADVNFAWSVEGETPACVTLDLEGGKLTVSALPESEETFTLVLTATCGNAKATKNVTVHISAKGGEKEDVLIATLKFGSAYNSGPISGYENSWSATVYGRTWNIENFNNNSNRWNYVKAGSKNKALISYITTDTAMEETITKVVVTIGAITANSVNDIYLEVSSSSSFSDAEKIEIDKSTGDKTVIISNPNANRYYRLVVNCPKTKDNGVVQINEIKYYGYEG